MTFIAILITLAAIAIALLPLLRQSTGHFHPHLSHAIDRRKELREEKARLILTLREIDFDYEMNKLSAADYKEQHGKYEALAAHTLQALDEAETEWSEIQRTIDQKLEKRIPKPVQPASSSAKGSMAVSEGQTRFCPSCGTGLGAGDRFCGKCGSAVARASNA